MKGIYIKNNNVVWHDGLVTMEDRNRSNGYKSGIVWFTGLPGAGKSTIAHGVEKELFERNIGSYVVDGDNIRHGINSDLGFGRDDRKENLRRIAWISKLFVDAGVTVLAAFISPYKEDREQLRRMFEDNIFLEVYVKCRPEICEQRDPKQQYKKARAGILKQFTGISAPYEVPEHPDLIINTEELNIGESIKAVRETLERYLKL
ncbi:MAG: adenylyl-sulfate kinase [Nitrospirae bacterium]|nr:adenylyl-sulfate kinase [Nitrospirota bacterium]